MNTVISLYSGAGGLDIGFKQENYNILWANDFDKDAANTYKVNIGDHIRCGDINQYINELDQYKNKIDVMIGGPPCQGFSVAGKMDPHDPRSNNVWTYIEALKKVLPQVFVMENVKALGTLEKWSPLRDELLKEMRSLAWRLKKYYIYVYYEGMNQLTVSSKTKVLSLFSGCGGLDIPFSKDSYDLVSAYDIDPAAIACLKHNLKCDAKVLDVLSDDFEPEISRFGQVDVVLGGFPCQGFSKSGPKKADDPRNRLYRSMLRAVEILQPRVFVAENVDGMVQNFEGTFVQQIVNDFLAIGYRVEHKVLNAVNYGVGQYRRRIFFIGYPINVKHRPSWPVPTHQGKSRNGEFKTADDEIDQESLFFSGVTEAPRSLATEIGDLLEDNLGVPDHVTAGPIDPRDIKVLQQIAEGQKLCNVRFSDTSIYTWMIPSVFGEVSERERTILETIGKNRRKKIYGSIPNGNPLSLDVIQALAGFEINQSELESLASRGYLKVIQNKYDLKGAMFCSGLYKRPNWTEPSPTILTVFDSPRYFAHPKKNRPFTIRECARLQSFPDNFVFLEAGISAKDAYRLIGNAVPPKLAAAIETTVHEFLQAEYAN
jgi:DNA (cytosine-5)-methyltransferase 1